MEPARNPRAQRDARHAVWPGDDRGKPPPLAQLACKPLRDLVYAAVDEHEVVRRFGRPAFGERTLDDRDRIAERSAGGCGQIGALLERGDDAAEPRQDGSGIAGAGAHHQRALAAARVERLQQQPEAERRHHRAAASQRLGRIDMGEQAALGRHEALPRHIAERFHQPRRNHAHRHQLAFDHRLTRGARLPVRHGVAGQCHRDRVNRQAGPRQGGAWRAGCARPGFSANTMPVAMDGSDGPADVLVVGGGSAGWMAAAGLAAGLGLGRGGRARVALVESQEIGIVGVGEATIPPIRLFNRQLGLDEADFLRSTQGSFKLGIRFLGWGDAASDYFHPFGTYGADFDPVALHHWWLKARAEGETAPLDQHSFAFALANRGRFQPPEPDPRKVQSTFDYAYHFDASLYGRHLRAHAEAMGVVRHEGRIVEVLRDGERGDVAGVLLSDGRRLGAGLFVDCSGLRSLLLGEALGVPFDDWSHWLPADRAWAVPTAHPPARAQSLHPYTRSTAHGFGWQWRIPLRHRVGNGLVFSSAFATEEEARDRLLASLDGPTLAEPRLIRFRTGRRVRAWERNVVAIGLAAGFLEPLESTSIHLVQAAIARLLALFPRRPVADHVRDEFNRVSAEEWARVRDFLILHYHLNRRPEPLWRHCAGYALPDELAWRMRHFSSDARLVSPGVELFQNASWLAVHIGQGHWPRRWDPLADQRAGVPYHARLAGLRRVMAEAAEAAPAHAEVLARALPAAAQGNAA
jgi:tryptophan halogenase